FHFIVSFHGPHRGPYSFPTRRSSDLPDFFMVFTSDFSGRDVVISSNDDTNLCLDPGVTGLSFFNAMIYCSTLYVAVKIDHFALRQGHDRLLIIRPSASLNARLGVTNFQFAHHIHGVHALYVYTIQLFYGFADLYFIGLNVDNKAVAAFFVQCRHLFRYQRLFEDAHCSVFNRFTIFSTELSTKIRVSAFMTSYVLMFSAVVTLARCRLRADKTMFLSDAGRTSRVFLLSSDNDESNLVYSLVLGVSKEKSSSTAMALSFAL